MSNGVKLAVLLLFWAAVYSVQQHALAFKLPALAALLLSAVALLAAAPTLPRAPIGPRLTSGITIGCALLLLAQLIYFAVRLRHPRVLDMGTTTLAAGAALLDGQNPYALPLDAVAGGLSDAVFQGYKYLPVTIAAYLPLGPWLGQRGLLLTNLFLQLGATWLVMRLAGRAAGPASGRLAALLYLSLPLVALQVLTKGATDLVPVVPLLLAALWLETRPAAAGLCVGLSIAAKLVPGILFVPCFLPPASGSRWRYVRGVAAGMLPILPFALWSPTAFYDNIVAFNFSRPADATSWLAFAPEWAGMLARAGFLAGLLAVAAYVWRRPPDLATRCGLAAILTLGAILCGPGAHDNYQLWWLPFACVILAAAFARQPAETDRSGRAAAAAG